MGVLEGDTEGFFAYKAVNFLFGREGWSVGALDLGGASAQVSRMCDC